MLIDSLAVERLVDTWRNRAARPTSTPLNLDTLAIELAHAIRDGEAEVETLLIRQAAEIGLCPSDERPARPMLSTVTHPDRPVTQLDRLLDAMPEFIDAVTAARRLGISQKTLTKWRQTVARRAGVVIDRRQGPLGLEFRVRYVEPTRVHTGGRPRLLSKRAAS